MKRGWVFAIIVLVVLIVAGVVYLIAIEWGPAWVGIAGHSEPQMFDNQEYVPRKTLWDLLELLIVPAALGLIAWWFSNRERKDDRDATEKRAQTDREIAADRLQEAALHAYLDKMSELLFEKNLREAIEGEEVISIARSKTLATLRSMDGVRKGILIKFLYEAQVINTQRTVITLDNADLSKVYLRGANLKEINLSRANLSGANLSRANLDEADLSEADLSEADLHGAILNKAKLNHVNLQQADLEYTKFNGSQLRWANLKAAKLRNAELIKADLRGAQLPMADLEGIDLTDAIMSYAVLIRTLKLTNKQLAKVKTLHGTMMDDLAFYNPNIHTNIAQLRKEEGLDDGNTPPEKLVT